MNAADIIKGIEQEQLKEKVDEFHVGDTVKVYGKIKEGNREHCIKETGWKQPRDFHSKKIF